MRACAFVLCFNLHFIIATEGPSRTAIPSIPVDLQQGSRCHVIHVLQMCRHWSRAGEVLGCKVRHAVGLAPGRHPAPPSAAAASSRELHELQAAMRVGH